MSERPAGGTERAERPSLVRLLVTVHEGLACAGVDHAFGGAIALAYYVEDPRTTRDIDVNVSAPLPDAERVFTSLPPSVAWSSREVAACGRDGQVRLWSGAAREGIPVDLFFPQHSFHAAVAAATQMHPFADPSYMLPVVSAAHLTVFKVLFNRPKDWLDIAAMLQAGSVDTAEALGWVGELLGEDHPSFERLAGLVFRTEDLELAVPGAPGAEMELPLVDWRALTGER